MRGTLCVPQDAVFCAEGATEEEESQVTGSAEAGDGKADFEHIYNRPDPRDYFRTLGKLDYEIPQRAQPVFQALLTALRSRREGAGAAPLRVLDLCCSYGVESSRRAPSTRSKVRSVM